MVYMKRLVASIGLLFLCPIFTMGQLAMKDWPLLPLKSGDLLPELSLPVRNYDQSILHFSNLRGKLVLLDFWFGTCKSCIDAFPKLERFQKQYGDRLQIVLVNFESAGKIDSTFRKWKNIPGYRLPQLPCITNDSLLHRLFGVQYYPHTVWIDTNGRVLAATDGAAVTEKNIETLLAGHPVPFAIKDDSKIVKLTSDALWPQLSQPTALLPKYYSVLLPYAAARSGATFTSIIDTATGTVRVSRLNHTRLELLGNALHKGIGTDPFNSREYDYGKRVTLKVRDSTLYFWRETSGNTKSQWNAENRFSYECILPIDRKVNVFELMLSDLQNYFNLDFYPELQLRETYVLVRTSSVDKVKSTSSRTKTFFESDSTLFQIQKGTMDFLIKRISEIHRNSPWIFADGTNYTNKIDIELPLADTISIDRLKQVLRERYDLDLVLKEYWVEVLIIRERLK